MRLTAISPREASIFACFTDTVVAPEPVLPSVARTDAVEFFDRWMGRAPALNRLALRGLLYALELAPRPLRYGGRLRQLGRADRARYFGDLERAPVAPLRQLVRLVKRIAFLSYYGDDAVMLRTGYDAEANLRRARELRDRDGRP